MQQREDRVTVNAFDCQPDGRIRLNVLMQYLQEAAARHAEQLAVGFADLEKRGCFWVLATLRLEIASLPRWTDGITIRTWPSGCTRVAATREFVGLDAEQRELWRASSEWMILDKHTGRLKNLTKLGLNLPADGPKVLPADAPRLQSGSGYAQAGVLRVPFSALDFNGHVNNTEFVRWGLDGLHRMVPQMPAIRRVHAAYLAEVFEGDEIEILVATDGSTQAHILERKAGTPAANAFLMEVSC